MVQKSDSKQYWFKQDNLLKPIDWEFIESLPDALRYVLKRF